MHSRARYRAYAQASGIDDYVGCVLQIHRYRGLSIHNSQVPLISVISLLSGAYIPLFIGIFVHCKPSNYRDLSRLSLFLGFHQQIFRAYPRIGCSMPANRLEAICTKKAKKDGDINLISTRLQTAVGAC